MNFWIDFCRASWIVVVRKSCSLLKTLITKQHLSLDFEHVEKNGVKFQQCAIQLLQNAPILSKLLDIVYISQVSMLVYLVSTLVSKIEKIIGKILLRPWIWGARVWHLLALWLNFLQDIIDAGEDKFYDITKSPNNNLNLHHHSTLRSHTCWVWEDETRLTDLFFQSAISPFNHNSLNSVAFVSVNGSEEVLGQCESRICCS